MGRRPGLNANNFTLPVPQWHYCGIKTPTSEHQGQYLASHEFILKAVERVRKFTQTVSFLFGFFAFVCMYVLPTASIFGDDH
jgi:hypothetical protein